MNRRHFFSVSAGTLAAACLPVPALAEGPAKEVFSEQSLGPYLQGNMTAAVFDRHVGSTFYAAVEDGAATRLVLRQVIRMNEYRQQLQSSLDSASGLSKGPSRPGVSATGVAAQVPGHVAGVTSGAVATMTRGDVSARGAVVEPSGYVPGFLLAFDISGKLTEQATYVLDHARLGHMAVFLVPDGKGKCTATFAGSATMEA